jgi:hypothetical protein
LRLNAQVKAGFYPAPPEAVAMMARYLVAPSKPWAMIDPCAGEGAAVRQFADLLGCPNVHAIELDSDRAERVREVLPDGKVLAPCSMFGTWVSLNSFSFVYANPPFDQSLDGGRVESQFLKRATEWLRTDGILALVCPESQIEDGSWGDIPFFLREWYDRIQVVPFPEFHRPFNEVVVFGVKRAQPANRYCSDRSWESIQAIPGSIYHIPPGRGPTVFKKVEPTEEELSAALAASPLRSRWTAPEPVAVPSPPLALGVGHVALLLASGHLDGIVEPEGQPPHVVRGTSRKREYVSAVNSTVDSKGNEKTVTVMSQRIDLIVRTINLAGELRTYGDDSPVEEVVPEPEEVEA